MIKRPMLAGTITKEELDTLVYPVYVQAKLDGIRCLIISGIAYSRTMELIPNKYIQEMASTYPNADGELISSKGFQHCCSIIMSEDKTTEDISYYVFDNPTRDCGYLAIDLETYTCNNSSDILEKHKEFMEGGYEGTIIRGTYAKYKQGRGTKKDMCLLKYKDMLDAEATVIDVVQGTINMNTKEVSKVGLAKRSTAKAGKILDDIVGSFVVEFNGSITKVGTGCLTDSELRELWGNKPIGKTITFKYQNLTNKGMPRFPQFLRFRDDKI